MFEIVIELTIDIKSKSIEMRKDLRRKQTSVRCSIIVSFDSEMLNMPMIGLLKTNFRNLELENMYEIDRLNIELIERTLPTSIVLYSNSILSSFLIAFFLLT